MASPEFRLGDFVVHPALDRLQGKERRVDLEPKTMAVLLALSERSGQVVSSEELIRIIWRDRPMGDNPVYKSIAKLRRALGDDPAAPRYIETIPRKGYRLLAAPQPMATLESVPAIRTVPRSRYPRAALTAVLVIGLAILAPRIVDGLARLRQGAERPIPHARILSPEVDQLYLLARAELRERRPGFIGRLATASDDLLREAPDFAPAYALRAVACTLRIAYADQPAAAAAAPPSAPARGGFDCAQRAVRHALALDGRSAEVQAAAGLLAYEQAMQCRGTCNHESLLDAAQWSLEEAVESDPTLPEARGWLGLVDLERGDLVRAAAQAEAALELDPLSPVAAWNANTFLLARGQVARAQERLTALVRRPEAPAYVFLQLAETEIAQRRPQDALRSIERALATDATRSTQVQGAAMLAVLGRTDGARTALAADEATQPVDRGETLWLALLAHYRLDGREGVSRYLAEQTTRRAHDASPPAAGALREWQEFRGYAYALLGQPHKARPLLEAAFGASGAPLIRRSHAQEEADRANALAWAYRETGDLARAHEVARGALAALDEIADAGFGENAEFALTRSLACELAGRRADASAEFARAQSLGLPQGADVLTDPRWQGFIDGRALRLSARM